jgi:glyoxylase-like metal-dependent hydrolase (beta-lactamase superfamily II)
MDLIPVFTQLRLQVLQRGWLSSNNIVFKSAAGSSTAIVDTGYDAHAAQTVTLLESCLAGEPLARIFNTHLHSDHCGGNAALQRTWGSETAVPAVSLDAVSTWNQDQLTFDATAQRCDRFAAHTGLEAGSTVVMGGHHWRVLEAPGHDADALMFFEPNSRVLISGDALWESRLAIVFPEFEQRDGFGGVEEVLGVIAKLNATVVIPGHGRPFSNVAAAIAASLRKLRQFQLDPALHRSYAMRALTMFHMLEVQHLPIHLLIDWMLATPIFSKLVEVRYGRYGEWRKIAERMLLRMIADGILMRSGDVICIETAKNV